MAEAEDVNLSAVPIKALKPSTCNMLGRMLDHENDIFNKKGLSRDWRGLAELADFEIDDIRQIRTFSERTVTMLSEWQKRCLECPTIETLCDFLIEIERYDVLDDMQAAFEKDAKIFLAKHGTVGTPPLIQVPEVSSGWIEDKEQLPILTVDDTQNGVQQYDAYVCYTEEDHEFLKELRDKLENEFHLKLCFKDRDLLIGCNEINAAITIIQQRCRRLLLIITPAFLKSPHLNFQYLYAQALSIEEQQRRIIPIIYKPCQLPSNFRFLARLDYTKNDIFQCFWERLVQSIRETPQFIGQSIVYQQPGGSSPMNSGLGSSEGYGSWQSTPDLATEPLSIEKSEPVERLEISREELTPPVPKVAKTPSRNKMRSRFPNFGRFSKQMKQ